MWWLIYGASLLSNRLKSEVRCDFRLQTPTLGWRRNWSECWVENSPGIWMLKLLRLCRDSEKTHPSKQLPMFVSACFVWTQLNKDDFCLRIVDVYSVDASDELSAVTRQPCDLSCSFCWVQVVTLWVASGLHIHKTQSLFETQLLRFTSQISLKPLYCSKLHFHIEHTKKASTGATIYISSI